MPLSLYATRPNRRRNLRDRCKAYQRRFAAFLLCRRFRFPSGIALILHNSVIEVERALLRKFAKENAADQSLVRGLSLNWQFQIGGEIASRGAARTSVSSQSFHYGDVFVFHPASLNPRRRTDPNRVVILFVHRRAESAKLTQFPTQLSLTNLPVEP